MEREWEQDLARQHKSRPLVSDTMRLCMVHMYRCVWHIAASGVYEVFERHPFCKMSDLFQNVLAVSKDTREKKKWVSFVQVVSFKWREHVCFARHFYNKKPLMSLHVFFRPSKGISKHTQLYWWLATYDWPVPPRVLMNIEHHSSRAHTGAVLIFLPHPPRTIRRATVRPTV